MTQKQLEDYLWGAANILTGMIDAADFKQYIFPLLFSSGFLISGMKNIRRHWIYLMATWIMPNSVETTDSKFLMVAIGVISVLLPPI